MQLSGKICCFDCEERIISLFLNHQNAADTECPNKNQNSFLDFIPLVSFMYRAIRTTLCVMTDDFLTPSHNKPKNNVRQESLFMDIPLFAWNAESMFCILAPVDVPLYCKLRMIQANRCSWTLLLRCTSVDIREKAVVRVLTWMETWRARQR